MPNRPLRTCPTCSGTGQPSFVRSGKWLNAYCPGKNGPVDADDYPDGHELDCSGQKSFFRVEYKRPREEMYPGQFYHLQALHGLARPDWTTLLLVVTDEGQSDAGAPVGFRWLTSKRQWSPPDRWPEHRTTLDALGKGIARWVWGAGPKPIFLEPPPPGCASCGVLLPGHSTQTMPIDGENAWVCLDCFREHFGLRTLPQREELAG